MNLSPVAGSYAGGMRLVARILFALRGRIGRDALDEGFDLVM